MGVFRSRITRHNILNNSDPTVFGCFVVFVCLCFFLFFISLIFYKRNWGRGVWSWFRPYLSKKLQLVTRNTPGFSLALPAVVAVAKRAVVHVPRDRNRLVPDRLTLHRYVPTT